MKSPLSVEISFAQDKLLFSRLTLLCLSSLVLDIEDDITKKVTNPVLTEEHSNSIKVYIPKNADHEDRGALEENEVEAILE